jgi:hypothetical protein
VKLVIACATLMLLTGCATQMVSYAPAPDQVVVYNQGVGAITWETNDAVLTMYPTFRLQSPDDIPTFTLMVQNKTNHSFDFVPESIQAYLDDSGCHVYTYEERVAEIRSTAKKKQIALAIVGGLAAGAAAYGASHQTTTYSGYATNGYRSVWTSGTIQTYDPAAGIFAGAAVGAVTVVGIHQIGTAAGYEVQAAQAIFQHTTIRPGTTIVGQVMLKVAKNHFSTVRLDVPVDTAPSTFMFAKRTITSK